MTIASAFNDIAVEQGGTAAKSGAITAAIDALNDALAGSDQPQAKTIEQAVRLLGEHIGGGVGTVKCYMLDADNPMTPLNVGDVSVKDFNEASVAVSEDSIEAMGETVSCISFTATVGGVYAIQGGDRTLEGGELGVASNPEKPLPSTFYDNFDTMSLIAFNEPMIAMLSTTR